MIAIWENGLRGVRANHLAESLTKPCSPGQGSAAPLWQAAWVAAVSGPPPAVRTQPALLLSVLCHQSPGRARNLPRRAKPPFYWKNFQNEHVPWDDCRSQKRDTEQQNVKRKGPPRFGVLDHWLFPMRGPCFLQATAFTEPPCPLSLQSSLPGGKSLSLGGWENVRSKQRVE